MMRGDSPEELAMSAEKWLLEAEKLRLEATRDELLLQKEKNLEKKRREEEEKDNEAVVVPKIAEKEISVRLVEEFSWAADETIGQALPHAPATMTEEIAREIVANVSTLLPSSARVAQWCTGGVVFRGSFNGEQLLDACDEAVEGYRFFWVQDDLEPEEFESWIERYKYSGYEDASELWEGMVLFSPMKPPALVAVDSSIVAPWQPLNQPARIVSFVLTFFTILLYSAGTGVLNDIEDGLLVAVAPVGIGIVLIELSQQLAQRSQAELSGVDMSPLGVPLPSLPTGMLGFAKRLRRHPKTRQALFDTALAGPAAGLIVSIFYLVAGVIFASTTAGDGKELLLPADIVRGSTLASAIYAAGNGFVIQPHTLVPADPFFIAGLAGVVSSSCQMLPIGRTDGGRLATARFGKFLGLALINLFKYFAAGVALFTGNSVVMLYIFYVVTLQNSEEIACRDDITPISDFSRKAHAAALAIAFFALLPLPGALFGGNQQQQQQMLSMGTSDAFASSATTSRQALTPTTTSAASTDSFTPTSTGNSRLPAGFPEIM